MDSIIFDVDGTLWDSTEICAKAWTDVIHRETSLSLTINASTLKGLFAVSYTHLTLPTNSLV